MDPPIVGTSSSYLSAQDNKFVIDGYAGAASLGSLPSQRCIHECRIAIGKEIKVDSYQSSDKY